MAWFADWQARRDAMIAHGLPARVVGVELMPPWDGRRLLAVALDIDERYLPRSHEARGFDLHLSLLFEEEVNVGLAVIAGRLHERWAGQHIVLRVAWMGSGGAAFLGSGDPLLTDPDVQLLHGSGWYAGRDMHISL